MSKRKYESYMLTADDGTFEVLYSYSDAFAAYNRELKNRSNPMLCGIAETGQVTVIFSKKFNNI